MTHQGKSFNNPTIRLVIGIVLWGVLTATGFAMLAIYSNTPGVIGPPPRWQSTNLPGPLPDDQYLLVMSIHPKCPCTHASLGELARVLRHAEGNLHCQVLVYQPESVASDWSDTRLVATARELPATTLYPDVEGELAKQLNMSTSGSVVLYSSRGEAMFYGGITSTRSHHGDNLGSNAVLAILAGESTRHRSTSVYGCPIEVQEITCGRTSKFGCQKERP